MPSPVWLDNDQGLDFYDVLDELLLDGDDDYFDQRRSVKRKRGADQSGIPTSDSAEVPSKRQKHSSTEDMCGDPAADSSTPTRIVVWRTQDHDALSHPLFSDGSDSSVALLKDWRERFKDSAVNTTFGGKRRSIKTASAVVVERRQPTDASRRSVSPLNTKTKPFAKRKVAKPSTNDHARTAATRETSNNKHGSATDTHRLALAHRGNTTKAISLKRKAPDGEEEEDELQANHGDVAIPKKRVMTRPNGPMHPPASGAKESNMGAPDSKPVVPSLRTKRSTVRPHTASTASANVVDKGHAGAAITRSAKRKK